MMKMSNLLTGATLLLTFGLAVSIDVECGGNLNNASGEIVSPGYPQPYTPGIQCTWTLPKHGFIWIADLDLNHGDVLVINDGPSDQKMIKNFTGRQDFAVMYYSTENTTVVFTSKNTSGSAETGKFKLWYNTTACLIPVNNFFTQLRSPYFIPSNGTINCTYEVHLSNPEKAVDLTFLDFNLKKGQVTLYDGSISTVTYTDADSMLGDVISAENHLAINMLLSATVRQSFTVGYSEVDKKCSKRFEPITNSITLKSPGYPDSYDNDLSCVWIVPTSADNTLVLEFSELSMADVNDRVIIKDGDSALSDNIGIFSMGSKYNGIYYLTSSNSTMVQFRTDLLLKARGFSLSVTPQAYGRRFVNSGQFHLGIPPNSTTESIPSAMAPSGGIISYQFQAPKDSQVYLVLGNDAVLLPNTSVECYDGLSSKDGLVGYFTSQSAFHAVFSNGESLLVVIRGFLNNGTMTHQYLTGSFHAVNNDGTLVNSLDDTGGLTLSMMKDEYPWTATWLIHNYEAKEIVALKLHEVLLGENSSVSVYQGLSDQSWLMAKINVSTIDVPEIYIPRDQSGCRLVYDTRPIHDHVMDDIIVNPPAVDVKDLMEQSVGLAEGKEKTVLKATFTRVADCQSNMTASSGIILTPGYPGLYPFNADCSWTIATPGSGMIHLAFNSFDLTSSHTVMIEAHRYHDYNVTVGNKTVHVRNVTVTNLGTFGGIGPFSDIITSLNDSEIKVTFSSAFEKTLADGIHVSRGVNISYEVLECGGNVTGLNASLSVPRDIHVRNATVSCVWIISLPNVSHANGSVNIISFQYHLSKMNTSSLVIRDGASSTSESIPLNSSDSRPTPLLSRTDKLWIRYTFQAAENGIETFQLNYTTYVCPKSKQCNNSICMHDDWRCNGRDDCGDGSDEDGCVYNKPGHEGYPSWALAVAILATFVIAVALTMIVLVLYKRYRYSNYSQLSSLMAPVPT